MSSNVTIIADNNDKKKKTNPWSQKDDIINEKNRRIKLLEDKVKRLLRLNDYCMKKCDMLLKNKDSCTSDAENEIRIAIDTTLSRCGMRNRKKSSKLVAKAAWCPNFMNGLVRDNLRVLARDELKFIFSPLNILKKMDTSSGALNFSSLEMLREVENENGKNVTEA